MVRMPIGATLSEMQTPYDTQINVWRNEQPGSDPTLHASVQLTPREGELPWSEVKLNWLHLRSDESNWTPKNSVIERLSGGVYQIRAVGAPTIEAGANVVVVIQLATSEGDKEIVFPGDEVEVME